MSSSGFFSLLQLFLSHAKHDAHGNVNDKLV